MSFKKTIIFAVLFIVLGGFYYWDQQRIKTNTTREESQSRLVTPKPEALSEIIITPKGQPALTLQKQGEEWQIVQPLEARIDQSALKSMLGELDRAKKVNPFDAAGKLEAFGLKSPQLSLQIKGAGYAESLELGGETPAHDEVYARLPQDKASGGKIFTLPVSFKRQFLRPAAELRDKRLLPANLNEATSFTLAFDGKRFDLARRDDGWSLAQPIKGKADDAKMVEMLQAWNETRAIDFIDTRTLDLARYGLDKPVFTASFSVAGKARPTPLTLLVGGLKGETLRYAMQQGGKSVMLITDDSIQKLKPSVSGLRSKQLVHLKPAEMQRVIFNVRGKVTDIERDSGANWHFRGDKASRLDNSLITQKLADLAAMQAMQFFDAGTTASTGLESPNLRLTIVGKDGTSTETLMTGKKSETADYVYAKLGSGELVGINWQQPGKFFVTRDELLDKSLFEFDISLVEKVAVRDGAKKIDFTRDTSGAWSGKPEGSTKSYQLDGTQMSALLYSVGSLNWTRRLERRYPTDLTLIKTQSLENPAREIIFTGADGKELARLGQGGEKDNHTYIRRGDKDDFFVVDKLRYASVKSALESILGALRETK